MRLRQSVIGISRAIWETGSLPLSTEINQSSKMNNGVVGISSSKVGASSQFILDRWLTQMHLADPKATTQSNYISNRSGFTAQLPSGQKIHYSYSLRWVNSTPHGFIAKSYAHRAGRRSFTPVPHSRSQTQWVVTTYSTRHLDCSACSKIASPQVLEHLSAPI